MNSMGCVHTATPGWKNTGCPKWSCRAAVAGLWCEAKAQKHGLNSCIYCFFFQPGLKDKQSFVYITRRGNLKVKAFVT